MVLEGWGGEGFGEVGYGGRPVFGEGGLGGRHCFEDGCPVTVDGERTVDFF